MRRLIGFGLALGLILGGVWFATSQRSGQSAPPDIRTQLIDRGDLVQTVSATGSVRAERAVKLGFRSPGVVAEVLVEEGDQVETGQIVARQDDTAPRLLVAQAQAALDAAEATLRRATEPPGPDDLALAQAAIDAAQGANDALFTPYNADAIRTAELRYQQAQQNVEAAEQRRRDTGGRVSTDAPAYQLALAQVGQAAFTAEMARLQLEALRRGPDSRAVSAAQARIAEAHVQLERLQAGLPAAEVRRLETGVEQARVALEQAQQALDDTVLRAPFAGTVTRVGLRRGVPTGGALPAIELVDTSRLFVAVRVDEVDIGLVAPGQSVALSFEALPEQTLSGTVDRVALVANPGGTVTTYDVRVSLDATGARPVRVRAGMTASAEVVVRALTDVVRVPNQFVRLDRRADQAFVNLADVNGELTETPITLGLRGEEYSEVLAGLSEGDRVGVDLSVDLLSLF